MLRRLAAGTGAALMAVVLAAVPAIADGLPVAAPDAPGAGAEVPAELRVSNRGHGSTPPPAVPVSPESSAPPESPPPPPLEDTAPPPAPPPPAQADAPPPEAPPPTTPQPQFLAPAEAVRPPARIAQAPTRLPQTGRGSRPLTATGGATLLAAGLAFIAGARRRRADGS